MAEYWLEQSSDPRSGNATSAPLSIGRVKSIVLGPSDPGYNSPADIGKITFELLYNQTKIQFSSSDGAYPIFSFIKQYPLISEIVLIVPGPGDLNNNINASKYYYFPAYSLFNSLNHNAFPNMKDYLDYVKSFYKDGPAASAIAKPPTLPLGYSFVESDDIRSLRAFEGDTIIESRWGQSIRFGSTSAKTDRSENQWSNYGTQGNPITIIRNGQGPQDNSDKFSSTVENINKDDSLIYLTSGQAIEISDVKMFPLKTLNVNYSGSSATVQYTIQKPDTSKISIPANNQKIG